MGLVGTYVDGSRNTAASSAVVIPRRIRSWASRSELPAASVSLESGWQYSGNLHSLPLIDSVTAVLDIFSSPPGISTRGLVYMEALPPVAMPLVPAVGASSSARILEFMASTSLKLTHGNIAFSACRAQSDTRTAGARPIYERARCARHLGMGVHCQIAGNVPRDSAINLCHKREGDCAPCFRNVGSRRGHRLALRSASWCPPASLIRTAGPIGSISGRDN